MTALLTYRIEERDDYGNPINVIDTFKGKPLDAKIANEYAQELSTGSAVQSGKRKVVVVPQPPTREQVWQILLDLWQPDGTQDSWGDAGPSALPMPASLHVSSYGAIEIRLDTNDRAATDMWATRLGLPLPEVNTQGWYRSGGIGVHKPTSPLLPEWSIDVQCHLDLKADASAHGDGLASPDPAEYAAWLEAKDVPTPMTRVTGGSVNPDGTRGVELSCGTTFDNFSDVNELNLAVGEHVLECTGFHDWTHEDDSIVETDEPMPEGVEGVQLGRAAEAVA